MERRNDALNTANKLTMLRVVMIPFFLIALYIDTSVSHTAAVILFVLASLTDFVDGQIARRWNQVTDFGKFMDPLADKVLTIAAMCYLTEVGLFPGWALAIVITREFAVTSLRLVAVETGRVIAAAWSGKIKTASSMVCIILLLAFKQPPLLIYVEVAVITITTVVSGVEYFYKNRDVILALNMK